MKATITADVIRKIPTGKDIEVWDTKLPGLVLRVRQSGSASYAVLYGRGKKETLGRADVLTPTQARELARRVLGDIAHGKDPRAERRKRKAGSVRGFLDSQYEAWATTNRKTGAATVGRVKQIFSATILDKPITELTAWHFTQWRTERKRAGISDATINRDFNALRSVLSKAVEWGLITEHPMRSVKAAKVDLIGRLRYLSPAEEKRLRVTLEARDAKQRAARQRFNVWRKERGHKLFSEMGTYCDHMTPIVLLSLNTGLRRGELLALRWSDVDRAGARLTVRGASAKTGMTRRIALNSEALDVLKTWLACVTAEHGEPEADHLVFAGPDGEAMFSLKTAWGKIATAATLGEFTFHDLRHSFASKLVQKGVNLNCVRELLGHRDIKMTLRYAHLAPEHQAAAVATLVNA